jgi:hypothetical protein
MPPAATPTEWGSDPGGILKGLWSRLSIVERVEIVGGILVGLLVVGFLLA